MGVPWLADPLPPTGLRWNTGQTTTTSVEVEWIDEASRSVISQWEIKIADFGSSDVHDKGSTSDRSDTRYTVSDLTPGKNYTVFVYGKSGDKTSVTAQTVDVTTSKNLTHFIFYMYNQGNATLS